MPLDRLLVVGFSREGFGFGRVLNGIMPDLATRYDLTQFELSFGDPIAARWPVYSNAVLGDRYGETQIADLVGRVRPDVVLVLTEAWNAGRFAWALATVADAPPCVAYCSVDGDLIPGPDFDDLARLTRVVAYNTYCRDQIARCLAARGVAAPPLDVIPHGVDRAVFFPLDENLKYARAIARSALFPGRPDLTDAFIVLNANRNQPRKRVDLTIEGFARFAEGKPKDVFLCLHMGKLDYGPNFMGVARHFGVADRILRPSRSLGPPRVDLATLNRIYNACDVGINTANAEAWGLVSFEHAQTRAAQVVPGHGALREVWGHHAALFLETTPERTLDRHALVGTVSPSGVAEALNRLYLDRSDLARQTSAAYRHASGAGLSWSAVADRFDQTLQRARSEPRSHASTRSA